MDLQIEENPLQHEHNHVKSARNCCALHDKQNEKWYGTNGYSRENNEKPLSNFVSCVHLSWNDTHTLQFAVRSHCILYILLGIFDTIMFCWYCFYSSQKASLSAIFFVFTFQFQQKRKNQAWTTTTATADHSWYVILFLACTNGLLKTHEKCCVIRWWRWWW